MTAPSAADALRDPRHSLGFGAHLPARPTCPHCGHVLTAIECPGIDSYWECQSAGDVTPRRARELRRAGLPVPNGCGRRSARAPWPDDYHGTLRALRAEVLA